MDKHQDLKPNEELKGYMNEEKLNPDEEKVSTPLPEHKVTDVVTYEVNDSKLVVETVPGFRNFQNFMNKPRKKVRYYNEGKVVEEVRIDYELFDNPEFELLFNQTEKIVLNGEKVEKTRDNVVKFLENKPSIFTEILNRIVENSGGMGLILKNRND